MHTPSICEISPTLEATLATIPISELEMAYSYPGYDYKDTLNLEPVMTVAPEAVNSFAFDLDLLLMAQWNQWKAPELYQPIPDITEEPVQPQSNEEASKPEEIQQAEAESCDDDIDAAPEPIDNEEPTPADDSDYDESSPREENESEDEEWYCPHILSTWQPAKSFSYVSASYFREPRAKQPTHRRDSHHSHSHRLSTPPPSEPSTPGSPFTPPTCESTRTTTTFRRSISSESSNLRIIRVFYRKKNERGENVEVDVEQTEDGQINIPAGQNVYLHVEPLDGTSPSREFSSVQINVGYSGEGFEGITAGLLNDKKKKGERSNVLRGAPVIKRLHNDVYSVKLGVFARNTNSFKYDFEKHHPSEYRRFPRSDIDLRAELDNVQGMSLPQVNRDVFFAVELLLGTPENPSQGRCLFEPVFVKAQPAANQRQQHTPHNKNKKRKHAPLSPPPSPLDSPISPPRHRRRLAL